MKGQARNLFYSTTFKALNAFSISDKEASHSSFTFWVTGELECFHLSFYAHCSHYNSCQHTVRSLLVPIQHNVLSKCQLKSTSFLYEALINTSKV